MKGNMASVKALVEAIVRTGLGYLDSLTESNQLDITRFQDVEVVVRRWLRTCIVLSHAETLEKRCNALVDCTALKEDHLVQIEVVPIDIRAKLSRANLEARSSSRRACMRRLHNVGLASKSRDNASGSQDGQIEAIKRELLAAENATKAARRDLRAWNREVRKLALEFAPEMFLVLPDLSAPGSVLGDGGFGELAGIPRKRFQDYEIDYTTPVAATGTDAKGLSQEGRHKLLRATYDGEPVVLKMF